MTEITELDMNKYLVLKWDDIKRYLNLQSQYEISRISTIVAEFRNDEGKPDNRYLVLNLDDEIDFDCIIDKLTEMDELEGKVKDIAVMLVNAILIKKE